MEFINASEEKLGQRGGRRTLWASAACEREQKIRHSPSGLFGAHFTRSCNIIEMMKGAGPAAISARERAAQKTAKPAAGGKLSVRRTDGRSFVKHVGESTPPHRCLETHLSSLIWLSAPPTGPHRPHAYFNKVYLVYLAPIFSW